MILRGLSLSIFWAVLLPAHAVQSPDPADVDAARAEFTRIYRAFDSAFSAGRTDDLAAYLMPNATVRTAQQVVPFRNTLADLQRIASQGSVSWNSQIVSVVLSGGEEASVTVSSDVELMLPESTRRFRGTSRDTWVRQPGGWRLRQLEWLKQERVVPPSNAETVRQVVGDLRRCAVPLASDEPGARFDDLGSFGKAIGDASVVALGEATHGTREIFRMKHRLLEYLVREKGFTVFAIEGNWPESLAVDRYIKTGEGDPKSAIRGMSSWVWYTEEFLDLIQWMREFNKAAGNHPLLTFTSFDMQTGTAAASLALRYLRTVSPADATKVQARLYAAAAIAGRLLPDATAAKAAAEQVAGIVATFDRNKAAWIEKSSYVEWRDARQAANVVRQSALNTVHYGSRYRDQEMARNVEWLVDKAHPGEKLVLWSHNGHVSVEAGSGSMGELLRRRFAAKYHVLGFAIGRGQLRANPGASVHSVPASASETGGAVLGSAGVPLFYLDLRALPTASALRKWLASPQLFVEIGAQWNTENFESNLFATTLSACYDSLIFVNESRPTTAPPN